MQNSVHFQRFCFDLLRLSCGKSFSVFSLQVNGINLKRIQNSYNKIPLGAEFHALSNGIRHVVLRCLGQFPTSQTHGKLCLGVWKHCSAQGELRQRWNGSAIDVERSCVIYILIENFMAHLIPKRVRHTLGLVEGWRSWKPQRAPYFRWHFWTLSLQDHVARVCNRVRWIAHEIYN